MNLDERIERIADHAQKIKNDHVKSVKGKRGRTDIPTAVQAYRGDELVAMALIAPHRDNMLRLAQVCAKGYGADTIALANESYNGNVMEDPRTGERWAPGAMATWFEEQGPDNKEVSECLLIMGQNRADDEFSINMPYLITGRIVEWSERSVIKPGPDTGQLSGIVPEALRRMMRSDTVAHHMARVDAQMPEFVKRFSPEARQAHMDIGTTMAMPGLVGDDVAIMLCAEKGSERHQVLREKYGPADIIDPSEMN